MGPEFYLHRRVITGDLVESFNSVLGEPTSLVSAGKVENLALLVIRFHNMYETFSNPESEARFINRYADMAFPIIHKYEGIIDNTVSHDGTLAYFGTHQQQEHELRALQTALELREALVKLEEIDLYQVGMGMGINSGEVYSGDLGNYERADATVFGNPLRLCHMMADASDINGIVIGENTYQALKDKITTSSLVEIKPPYGKPTLAYRVGNLK